MTAWMWFSHLTSVNNLQFAHRPFLVENQISPGRSHSYLFTYPIFFTNKFLFYDPFQNQICQALWLLIISIAQLCQSNSIDPPTHWLRQVGYKHPALFLSSFIVEGGSTLKIAHTVHGSVNLKITANWQNSFEIGVGPDFIFRQFKHQWFCNFVFI